MIYLYETVPLMEGDKAVHYEIEQEVTDQPLTRHPKTGELIRRVILGGWGIFDSKTNSSCCDPSGCC